MEYPTQVLVEWITAAGTVGIPIVAAWWTYTNHKSEKETRKRREIESLEGDMAFAEHPYGAGTRLVAIEMTWINKGPEPITAVPEPPRAPDGGKSVEGIHKWTRIEIFPIPEGLATGAQLSAISLGETAIATLDPLQGAETILEPGTSSLFRDHVVLETGRKYLVHWILQGVKKNDNWSKERILA